MKKKIILCVDDEPIVLLGLKNELARHFTGVYIVEMAEGAEEAVDALDFIKERGNELVAVVCDYFMPKMKGDELLVYAHKLFPEARTILLTGQANLEGITAAINGANLYRYISKPWESNDMLMTVEAAANSYEQDRQVRDQNEQLKELNANLEQKVQKRTRELQEKNDKIESSIRYAKRIQKSVLPNHSSIAAKIPDFFIFFEPRDVVSGDFYWYAEKENKAILAIVDCTGHGVPGAFMSLIGNDLLNRAVHDREIHDAGQILTHMNESLSLVWKNEQEAVHDGMDVALVVVDFRKKQLEFAGAKRPLLAVQGEEQIHIKGDKQSIGRSEANEPFTTHFLPLEGKTTRFYLFSDGYQDQFGGDEEGKFKSQRLRELLFSCQDLAIEEQGEVIKKTFFDWKKDLRQTDDVLVFGGEIAM
jgi:phosphoserine phosphatase RsbU/P